jgi:hypothetical protein
MKRWAELFFFRASLALTLITFIPLAFAASPTPPYLITYNDNIPGSSDTATFYSIAASGALSNPTLVNLFGSGIGGGYFTSNRINVLNSTTSPCVYISEAGSNTIAGIQALTQTVVGSFSASSTDNGGENGIGMAMNNNYLYANFSTTATIATFSVQPGCGLQFISDISPIGLNGGWAKGMALYGNMLIVTYGDGSIESFDVSGGLPVSNGDEQNATGYATDNFPDGVAISLDGQYAIFGDDSSGAALEVSDISSGQLTPTVLYSLLNGLNSNNVVLSPDGTLLYIVNNTSGQISAAFFDPANGAITYGCTSAELNGFDSTFSFAGTLVPQPLPGSGSALYLAEFGHPSGIGIVNISNVSASNDTCTLTEASSSPVFVASNGMLSLATLSTQELGLYNPAPSSTLTSSNVTFQWNGPTTATAFQIEVGSSPGGSQYYQSGTLPATTLSATVATLPTNGRTVYVTLSWFADGSWVNNSYTYTAVLIRQHKG